MSIFNFLCSVFDTLRQDRSTDFNAETDDTRAAVHREVSGPAFNVDGTPMMDCCFDVEGKAFGDFGSSFGHDSFDPCNDAFQSHDL
jgi:hypothetical protein